MTQDNIQTDTPQKITDETQYNSLEEAVFGNNSTEGSEDIASAFTNTGNKGEGETFPPIEGGEPVAPVNETIQQPQVQTNIDNDEKRYQYWQSQADKYKNELETVKQQQVQQQPVQQPAEPVEKVEDFPLPPERPKKPRTFNREEAYSDPASESARYQEELDEWRENINEYHSLKSQYQTAVIEEKFNKLETARVEDVKRHEAAQKTAAQASEVKSHVMGHYGMDETQAVDFMKKMSDPNSITIDNLVQLYRLQSGGSKQQPTSAPSQDFKQIQNAQQVPSPMGVMPSGQSNVDGKSFEDKVMDNLIGDFNSKNPWK